MKSSRLVQRLLIAIAAVSLIAVILVFVGYRRAAQHPQMIMDLVQKKADMHLDKIRQTASRNGIREWRMEAASATLMDGKKIMLLTRPDVEVFMTGGDNVHLIARQGKIYTETNRMTVSGDVVANTRLYRLSTEALEYDPVARELRSDTPVTLSGGGFNLQAGRMAMNLDTRVTRFEGGVEGTISDDLQL